ncbi:MAG: hypothetical protein H7146_02480 [Burkholderiaceae bacterium]|nr:hypothetical protein [Microbacteriaceae bacterium]
MFVQGTPLDEQTRCVHWHSPADVVAIRFACCREYYSCFECHEEHAGHAAERWPAAQWTEDAVLCGVCRAELSIAEYLASPGSACPRCGAAFNEGCRLHRHLYFETAPMGAG